MQLYEKQLDMHVISRFDGTIGCFSTIVSQYSNGLVTYEFVTAPGKDCHIRVSSKRGIIKVYKGEYYFLWKGIFPMALDARELQQYFQAMQPQQLNFQQAQVSMPTPQISSPSAPIPKGGYAPDPNNLDAPVNPAPTGSPKEDFPCATEGIAPETAAQRMARIMKDVAGGR